MEVGVVFPFIRSQGLTLVNWIYILYTVRFRISPPSDVREQLSLSVCFALWTRGSLNTIIFCVHWFQVKNSSIICNVPVYQTSSPGGRSINYLTFITHTLVRNYPRTMLSVDFVGKCTVLVLSALIAVACDRLTTVAHCPSSNQDFHRCPLSWGTIDDTAANSIWGDLADFATLPMMSESLSCRWRLCSANCT